MLKTLLIVLMITVLIPVLVEVPLLSLLNPNTKVCLKGGIIWRCY